MRINHNIPALRVLSQMTKSNSALDKSLERLSSGLRLNHAADDATGMAISHKMEVQVRGLQQSNRNALDGVSLIQTAEGALNEVHAMLQRIRELSVQVANGIYDDEDRKTVQGEVTQLQSEIARISDSVEFNGIRLLNGEADRRNYSSDSDIAEMVSMTEEVKPADYTFDITTAAAKTKGTGANITLFDAAGLSTEAGTLNINGEEVTIAVGDRQEVVFEKVRRLAERSKIDLTINGGAPLANGKQLILEETRYGNLPITVAGDVNLLNGLGLNGFAPTVGSEAIVDTSSLVYDNPATATVEGFPPGTNVVVKGRDIIFKGPKDFELRVMGGTNTGTVTMTVLEEGGLSLQIGSKSKQTMEVLIPNLSPRAIGLTASDLSTQVSSSDSIAILDVAISKISLVRSRLGAYQNRLEHTVTSLDVSAENMTASLSRIKDADMAYEMSKFTQQSIIQQAGIAMLAQANQRPQELLKLLQV